MSGVCGVFEFEGIPTPAAHFEAMLEAISSYGGDANGAWFDPPLALGHTLLRTTPQAAFESQPYRCSTSGLVVTADARLDNREELAEALDLPPARWSVVPDCELILRAYDAWGRRCLPRLLGSYAFSLWDPRKRGLLCARDPLGVRPLYYSYSGSRFVFSTEPRSVLSGAGVSASLDERFLSGYFLSGGLSGFARETFWRDVKAVLPGEALWVSGRNVQRWSHWDPRDAPQITLRTPMDYAYRLQELINEAVAARLRCSGPVGAHLSGGLDSSAIAVSAARRGRDRGSQLTFYSWSPSPGSTAQEQGDERGLIEAVAAQEGIRCEYCEATVNDVADYWFKPLDRTVADFYQEEVVRRTAAGAGVRVLLSGWGGDEFASSFGRGLLSDQLLSGQLWTCLREMRAVRMRRGSSLRAQLLRRGILPLLPDSVFYGLLPRLRPGLRDTLDHAVWSIPVGLERGLALRLSAFAPSMDRARPRRGVRRNHLQLLGYGHLAKRLQNWAASGAEHDIEYRYPLLDRRVVEFVLGVPGELFSRNGWDRWLFRAACGSLLPEQLVWARKKGDPSMFAENRRLQNELDSGGHLEQRIETFLARTQGWVIDRTAIRHLLDQGKPRSALPALRLDAMVALSPTTYLGAEP